MNKPERHLWSCVASSVLTLLIYGGISGCFSVGHSDSGSDTFTEPADEAPTVSLLVVASEGGEVEMPDGTKVEIPPGALASDTTITITRPDATAFGADGVLAVVQFGPEGTVFSQPVKVTIPFDSTGIDDTGDLVLAVASTSNPDVDTGSETSKFVTLDDAVRQGDSFVAEVTHFSVFAIGWCPQMFVTPLLPGKYMRPGDLLYVLTDAEDYVGASIWPMHVGIFSKGSSNNEVIESTIATKDCSTKNGVQKGTWDGECGFWRLKGQHLLAGIRRPNSKVTEAQGLKAAQAAESYIGSGYGIVGLSTPATGLTCVQLAEQAWEIAGVNMCYTPDLLLLPLNQFENSVPVKKITVDLADGEVTIPIVIAVKEGNLSSYTATGKLRVPADVSLYVDIKDPINEGRAFLKDAPLDTPQIKHLVFRPVQEDVGYSYTFGLKIEVPSLGYSRDVPYFLNIAVTGGGTGKTCALGKMGITADTPVFNGTISGSHSDNGEFSGAATARFWEASGGQKYLTIQGGSDSAGVNLDWPIPATPADGGTVTATHPGAGGEALGSWNYSCTVENRFVLFQTPFIKEGTVKIMPTGDCTKVTIEISHKAEQYYEGDGRSYSCDMTAVFTGAL